MVTWSPLVTHAEATGALKAFNWSNKGKPNISESCHYSIIVLMFKFHTILAYYTQGK